MAKTTNLVIQQTVDVPKILVIPKGEVRSPVRSFSLDLIGLNNNVQLKKGLHIKSLLNANLTS
ncbi:hypothetical protein [Trichormus azollae]|uniref:hypothetical protein n=1 Tax=Trichormus azollae TaxID=1164 RepID=UPI0001957F05|nr:hypothetical protein [Trichormus azollae]